MKPIEFYLRYMAFFFALATWGQEVQPVETIKEVDGELSIAYEKYKLKNGLTVIVHEDHSDPLVHVDVSYHVGSAREEPGKSGFAHFFEHMMFQGSKHVADEQHFKLVSESGGYLNGTTNWDRTNYYQTVPSDQLERILWLEADRMGFLLDAVTQEKFEVQRATVKNEKGQQIDNRPYGPHGGIMAETLYPKGHPYSWLTIGRLEDLDRADLNDLKNFFLRWYGPNNATLTVGGDVDAKQVIALAERYFGTIPRGPEVTPVQVEPVKLPENRYVSYYDKNIRFPALVYKFPTVPRYHKDEPALDALSKILGQGKTSYLFKTFMENGQVTQASSSHICGELAGEFFMFVMPYPGKSLSDMEAEMAQALADFDVNTITEEQIETFKTQYEAQLFQRLGTVMGKVSQLSAYETFRKNPNYLKTELEKYRSITKSDVVRVFQDYIQGRPAVVMSILAQKNAQPARPDNYRPTKLNTDDTINYRKSSLPIRIIKDTFDRSQVPPAGIPPVVSVPEYWETEWENGIKLIGSQSQEIPAVSLRLELYGGQLYDPKGKSGLGALTANLMNESTERYNSKELAAELEKLGSSISISSGQHATVISLWSLTKNLGPTLALLQEKLFRPAFTQADFDRLKKQAIERARASEQQPQGIARLAFARLLHGANHILTPPRAGYPEELETLTLEDVKEYYQKYYASDNAKLVIVGDITKDDSIEMLSFLRDWKANGINEIKVPEPPSLGRTTLYVVDKPDAPQSEVRMGYATGLRYNPIGDYYKAQLANYPLGGDFNSRINLNLREDKGYTYGARSGFSSERNTGYFIASASVNAEHTADAVHEFISELKTYKTSGITQKELEFTKAAIGRSEALQYETLSQKAGFLTEIVTYHLDTDYKRKQRQLLLSVTEAELDALAKKYICPEKMIILVVGDITRYGESLKALGLPMVEVDARGNPKESGTH